VNLQDFTPRKDNVERQKNERKNFIKKIVMVLYLASQDLSWLAIKLRQNLTNHQIEHKISTL
jgi:hypothetical protein